MRWMYLPAIALVACKSEQTFDQRQARVVVTPTLIDLGAVPVGATDQGLIRVDHYDGPQVDIRSVTVSNLAGEAFVYPGDAPLVLNQRASIDLPIDFVPLEEGWFRARVEIVHTGVDSPAVVDVRGHGVVPGATLSPLALDFGEVPVGGVASADVRLDNDGAVDLLVSEVVFSHTAFGVSLTLPQVVGAGDALVLPVRFTPTDDLAAVGEMIVRTGGVALPDVALRGNDCEGGDPGAYDRDLDGVTSCGGDCDDTDPEIRPGVAEVADAVDQDCDGEIDEGTEAHDDDGDGRCERAPCTDGSAPGDCNDADPDVSPDAVELLGNGIDDDCDGVVDSGSTDADFDGFDPVIGGDCDDSDPGIHPGAPELPNGRDDDCDGLVDEGTAVYDDDGDGACETLCTDGSLPGDCDDSDPTVGPGQPELPNWRDDDCDGLIDEGTVNADDDGDGYSEIGGDCDDADASRSPGLGTCP